MTKPPTRTPRSRRRRPPTQPSVGYEPPEMIAPATVEPLPPPSPPSSPSAEALREMTKDIDVPLAVELEKALEKALGTFAAEHGVLVRQACDVPDSHSDLADVIWSTFLGHTLQRLEARKGRAQVERLVSVLLDQFVASREHVAKLMGTLQ